MTPTTFFGFSALALFVGLTADIWQNVVQLAFLKKETLQAIERQHPYLPSLKIVMGIVLCTLTLFVTSLLVFAKWLSGGETFQWLAVTTLFADVCTLCILTEIRWKGARDYAFAYTIGTSVSFMLFLPLRAQELPLSVLLITLLSLVLCMGIAWFAFFVRWKKKVIILTAAVIAFWTTLFLSLH